jgi:hypothetical protein
MGSDTGGNKCSSMLCISHLQKKEVSSSRTHVTARAPPYCIFFGKGSSLLLRSVCALQKKNTGCAPTHRGRDNGHASVSCLAAAKGALSESGSQGGGRRFYRIREG